MENSGSLSFVVLFMSMSCLLMHQSVLAEPVTDIGNVEYESEPHLLSAKTIEYPAILLKKRIRGTITIEVEISEKGIVEKCTIKDHLHPMLDSIVQAIIKNSPFSPAYDRGTPVPSTIQLQIPFDPDSMLTQSEYTMSELSGIVYDQDSKRPLIGAIVNLQFTDTVSDTALMGHFNEYLGMIGEVPGQQLKSGIMSIKTDSLGYFAFRLLPNGIVDIAILAKGFSIKHFTEKIQTSTSKVVHYYIDPYSEEIDSVYEITVYGKDTLGREEINIEKQQYASGLTHYLNRIILTKAMIHQVPEAGSALLVRSGSPYDNCYLVAGVPLPSPFHFGGYPYADIDGIMLSAIDNVNVIVDRIAGVFPNVSGALIQADPGIYRPAPKKLKRRTEVSVDFSTLSQDFLISFPLRKQDYLQLGVTRSEDFSLKWLKKSYDIHPDAGIGIAAPVTFGNTTLTGKMLLGKIQTEYFSWFAFDIYEPSSELESSLYPWGMASVKLYPVNHKNFTITTGGGHQYFADGMRVGINSFLKTSELTNSIITVNYDSIKNNIVTINLSGAVQYQQWKGEVKQRDHSGYDTSVSEEGKEGSFSCKSTVSKRLGQFELGSNVLLTGVSDGNKPELLLDVGLSLLRESELFDIEFNIGKITSRPDIRGLPDSVFRKKRLDTYISSLLLKVKCNKIAKVGVQPYLRYQENAPQLDPLLKTWNPSRSTPLKAAGIDCDMEFKPLNCLELSGAINVSNAYRDKESKSTYEWNIPFSTRGRANFIFFHKLCYFYLEGWSSKGLPYYDFETNRYRRLPDYKRVDFSLQYRSPILKNRYFSRYDVYFHVRNILSKYNVRTYYWDRTMTKNPIQLSGPIYTEIGARLALRL
jgi:TonB family protein